MLHGENTIDKNAFAIRNIKPMTIGGPVGTLTDPEYLYELKIDGYRCVAFVEPAVGTDLRSKNNNLLLEKFPELRELHRLVKQKCILDGELAVLTKGGFPNFEALQARSHMSKAFAIKAAAQKNPITFIVFDILYVGNKKLTSLPLWERKQLLEQIVKADASSSLLQVSVYVEGDGTGIMAFAEKHGLEGIIAKRRNSTYMPGVRTKDWFKMKLLNDDDFIICGYFDSEKANVTTLILGQYGIDGSILDMGHVVLGRQRDEYKIVKAVPQVSEPPFPPSKSEVNAVWLRPQLVCTVTFSYRNASGGMRHAKFKWLRPDKTPEEAVTPTTT